MALSARRRPAVPLYDYQKRWVMDDARFKIGLMTRQGGKSFSTSLEAVSDAFRRKTKWVFLSAGERQSKELMLTARNHVMAYNLAIDFIEEEFKAEDGTDYKQLEISLPNGSRIIGLPANPFTARGHSAHILLDEFAFHKDSKAIWSALFPTVTRGYKIRVISTSQGKKNMFYRLWTGAKKSGWSPHKVDIYDAVAQGLELRDDKGRPCTPEDLRRALNDEDAWQQEYLCQFLDETTAFLTYELISECEDDRCLWDVPFSDAPSGTYFIGMDIGRKRDLSVIWVLEDVSGILLTREVKVMEKAPFRVQQDELFARIYALCPKKCCIDATGIGAMLAENAKERFPSCVEEVVFSGPAKEEMATNLRVKMEDKEVRIPIDRDIREDLHSIKKIVTQAGNIRYDADRSEKTGHADRFWALALAAYGASIKPGWSFMTLRLPWI